jgi:hypothetical protein
MSWPEAGDIVAELAVRTGDIVGREVWEYTTAVGVLPLSNCCVSLAHLA